MMASPTRGLGTQTEDERFARGSSSKVHFLEIKTTTRTNSITLFFLYSKRSYSLSLCLLIVAECIKVLGKQIYGVFYLQSLHYSRCLGETFGCIVVAGACLFPVVLELQLVRRLFLVMRS